MMKQPNGLDSYVDFFTLLGSEYIITLDEKDLLLTLQVRMSSTPSLVTVPIVITHLFTSCYSGEFLSV